MAKYRKKPVIVDTEQWFPPEAGRATNNTGGKDVYKEGNNYYINTLEGRHIVTSGDWIITGVKGEKYPCKPDIFELTYEKVEEGSGKYE